jgi:hypothetical protein
MRGNSFDTMHESGSCAITGGAKAARATAWTGRDEIEAVSTLPPTIVASVQNRKMCLCIAIPHVYRRASEHDLNCGRARHDGLIIPSVAQIVSVNSHAY